MVKRTNARNKLSAGITTTAVKALTTILKETTKMIVNLREFAEKNAMVHRLLCP